MSYQPFFSLHLDIQRDDVTSLDEALEQFMTYEALLGYKRGGRPGAEIKASQAATLDRLPSVLVLHLKRFCYSPYTGELDKLSKDVTFTPTLRLQPAMLSEKKNPTYHLRSLVVHHGSRPSGGHYTTYARRGHRWLLFNDGAVAEVTEKEVLRQQAYMLFYSKE